MMKKTAAMGTASPADWHQQAVQGDANAFWQLVRPHERLLFSVAFGVVRDGDEAQDVVQDTYLRAFSTLGSLREPGKIGGWLVAMARNIAFEHVRKNDRQHRTHSAYRHPEIVPVSDLLIAEEESAALDAAFKHLPEVHRVVLSLKYMNNLSCKEIAEALGIGVEAAKSRLFEARKALRARLAKQDAQTGASGQPPAAAQRRGVPSPILTPEKKVAP